jgi:hypothetical protein
VPRTGAGHPGASMRCGQPAPDLADDYRIEARFFDVPDMREPLATAGTRVLLQRGFLTVER